MSHLIFKITLGQGTISIICIIFISIYHIYILSLQSCSSPWYRLGRFTSYSASRIQASGGQWAWHVSFRLFTTCTRQVLKPVCPIHRGRDQPHVPKVCVFVLIGCLPCFHGPKEVHCHLFFLPTSPVLARKAI